MCPSRHIILGITILILHEVQNYETLFLLRLLYFVKCLKILNKEKLVEEMGHSGSRILRILRMTTGYPVMIAFTYLKIYRTYIIERISHKLSL
jgi:hypothetical protein